MKKSIGKVILPLLFAAPLLAGCSGGTTGSDSINILIWDDASNLDFVEEKVNEWYGTYRQTHPLAPEITFEYQDKGEAAAISDLQTSAQEGNGGDLVAITSDTLVTGVSGNFLAPITHAEDIQMNFDDHALAAATVNGQVYAYPITSESQVIMYDKRAVSDPSIFDSFENLLASGKRICWDVQGDDSAYYMFGFLNDAVLFGDDGTDPDRLDLNTPNAVNNYTSLLTQYKSAIYPMNPAASVSVVEAGQAVGVVSSPFLYANLVDALGEANVGLHVLPTINGQELRPFSGYKQYVINRYTPYPSIVNDIAKYLVSSDVQADRLYELNYLPTRYDGDIMEVLEANDNAMVYQESYENSIPMPAITRMAYYWTNMIPACETLWLDAEPTSSKVSSQLQIVEDAILAS